MAQHVLPRPLVELDLRDELGLHEQRALARLTRAGERARRTAQRREQPLELVQFARAEARADLAREAQLGPLARVVVVAHEERADPALPAAFAWQPATDHELLPARVLDLEPCAAAPAR